MNDSISELSSLVSNIILSDKVDSHGNNNVNINNLQYDDMQRKRRHSEAYMSTTASNSDIDLLEFDLSTNNNHGIRSHLPTGPELNNTTIFRSDSQEFSMTNQNDSSIEWDDETMESLLNLTNEVPRDEILVTATAIPRNPHLYRHFNSTVQTAKKMPYTLAEPMPLPAQTVQDLSQIINSLSPELQARFVDKLAETMGAHLATIMSPIETNHSDNHSDNNLALTTPELPKRLSIPNHNQILFPAQTVAIENNMKYGMMPETPSIAIPLASAALGAFVASLSNSQLPTSLVHRQNSLREIMQES